MLKLPESVITVLKDNNKMLPSVGTSDVANVNTFDEFDQLIKNSLLEIKSQEVTELCRTIYQGVVRNGFESSLSSSLIMLFTTIDDYSTLIEDREKVDEMEHDHYSQLLEGVNANLKINDALAKFQIAFRKKLQSEGKTVEAFQALLELNKLSKEKASLMKQQYRYMVAISTRTYKVQGDDLVIKKRKDLLLMRINIVKMLGDFNLTPKTIVVTSKGVKSSPLADLLSKGMNNGTK